MSGVLVAGVGMTPFGKRTGESLGDLAKTAAESALLDAGLAASDVGMVYFTNGCDGLLSGQECIRGEVALKHTGLRGKPIVNVENACASGSSGLYLASMSIRSGEHDVALVVGAEKMTECDKFSVFQAMSAGSDLEALDELRERVGGAPNRTVFMDIYASSARAYMAKTGATQEDFATVAVKSRRAASLNPIAQYRNPTSIEDVLNGRLIVDPLTLSMCSPIGDGGAAVLLVSESFARKRGLSGVRLLACSLSTGLIEKDQPSAASRAAHMAFEKAGLGPEDVDVVEVHDATASAEVMLYEDLGLCRPGEGVAYLHSGATGLGGRQAVNSSGGLLCRGHPIGATGCAQIVELTQQLRGLSGARQREGARIALAENGGGYMGYDAAAAVVTLLGI